MKKHYLLILLSILLGLHICALDVLAQSCTQLNLPENAIVRLCKEGIDGYFDLAFSPDGKTLAGPTGWNPKRVVLWDLETNTVKFTIVKNNNSGHYVRYSPDGKTFVCGDAVYDASTGEPTLLLLDGDEYTDYVLYSPDGKILAGAGPKGIRFWKSSVDEPPTDAMPVGDMTIGVLPTGVSNIIPETSDKPTSAPFATSSTLVPGIRGLHYSPDGKELAILCDLGIWIYDVEANAEKQLITMTGIHNLAYSPDGNTLAIQIHTTVHLLDAETKELKFIINDSGSYNHNLWGVRQILFSPGSDILITGTADYYTPSISFLGRNNW